MAATLKDIAEKCGVAVSTVSNILNENKSSFTSEKIRELVKQTAEDLGYKKDYLSISLRTRRTTSIGLCIDKVVDETRGFFINSFVRAFNRRQYEVAITEHLLDPQFAIRAIKSFNQRYKDGVALFTDFLRDIGPAKSELVETIKSVDTKVLGIGSELRGIIPCIDIERSWAFNDVRERMVGHKKVLVVYKTAEEFRNAFNNFTDERFIHFPRIYSIDDFTRAWKNSEALVNQITAVFFRSDAVAIPAVKFLSTIGKKIPEDISVISFDNYEFSAHTTPALTTYDINFSGLGETATDHLYKWVIGETDLPDDYYRTLRPQFIERESYRTV